MTVNIGNSWDELLKEEFEKSYYKQLRKFLIQEYKTREIYPSMYDIFNALKFTPYEDVKVVILGQDPYALKEAIVCPEMPRAGSSATAKTNNWR